MAHDPGCDSLALAHEAELACFASALHALTRDRGRSGASGLREGGGGGGGGGGEPSLAAAATGEGAGEDEGEDEGRQRARVGERYCASLKKRVAAIENATARGTRVALPRTAGGQVAPTTK